jgi:hypothetical protein
MSGVLSDSVFLAPLSSLPRVRGNYDVICETDHLANLATTERRPCHKLGAGESAATSENDMRNARIEANRGETQSVRVDRKNPPQAYSLQ